jgi:hypothetical protein
LLALLAGCDSRGGDEIPQASTQAVEPVPAFHFQDGAEPTVALLDDFDLAYFLLHADLVAESPVLRPNGIDFDYRIFGTTEQGDFSNGGPRSQVFIAVGDYAHFRDGNLKAFRISGLHFWEFRGIEEYGPDTSRGYFLSFKLASRPRRESDELIYRVRVGFERAEVELVDRLPW